MSQPPQIPQSAPKSRILEVALQLFSEHGVAGTSLQMIADTIGVTKAAVYHQFKTKDEIVIGSTWLIFEKLLATVERGSAAPTAKAAREVVVNDLIDLAVESRGLASFLQRDPIMLRYFEEHEPFSNILASLAQFLLGGDTRQKSRVAAALIITGIGSSVMHPIVSDISDQALRKHLRLLVQNVIDGLDD